MTSGLQCSGASIYHLPSPFTIVTIVITIIITIGDDDSDDSDDDADDDDGGVGSGGFLTLGRAKP